MPSLFRRALSFLRPVKWVASGAVVLSLFVAALNVVEPLVLKLIFDGLSAGGGTEALLRAVLLLVGVGVAREATQALGNWLSWKVRLRIQFDLLTAVVERLQTLPLSYHKKQGVGETLTRMERGVNGFVATLAEVMFNVVPAVFFLGTAAYVMIELEWRLALVAFLFLPLPLGVAALVAPEQVRRERDLLRRWSSIYSRFNEVLTGIVTVKSFAKEDEEKERFLRGVREANTVVARGVLRDSRNGAIQNLITAIARVAVIGFGGYLVLRGQTTLGTLIAFLGFVGALFGPVMSLSGVYQTVRRGQAALESIYGVLDAQDRLGDDPMAVELDEVEGRVLFDVVRFGYDQGRPLIDGLTLHVEPGETVALVGPSGAGKSTLMMLLQRLYDPTEGRVLIDGIDLRKVKQRSLRRHVGVVMQEPILFNDTVRNAIAYARPAATDQEVEAAARVARAHDFIMQMEQGYQTFIGERGTLLSAGQRQRLAIARAVLKDPEILILDEATSALDAETEAQVQEALEELMVGRTTFIIAHRLSTVVPADRILVLDRGRIVEEGTHEELLRQGGYYSMLVANQTRGLLPTDPGVLRAVGPSSAL